VPAINKRCVSNKKKDGEGMEGEGKEKEKKKIE
jgi:hypothetical protein